MLIHDEKKRRRPLGAGSVTGRMVAPSAQHMAMRRILKQEGTRQEVDSPEAGHDPRSAQEQDLLPVAYKGVGGQPSPYPYKERIESALGRPVKATAYMDGRATEACRSLGADAFAVEGAVAFASSSPSLHTATHEAVHGLQQNSGVGRQSGMGRVGDPHEHQADLVAERVVNDQSVAGLLQGMGKNDAAPAVQRQPKGKALPSHPDPWESRLPKDPVDMTPLDWSKRAWPDVTSPMRAPIRLEMLTGQPPPPGTTRPRRVRRPGHHRRVSPADELTRRQDEGRILWTREMSMRRDGAWEAYQKDVLAVQNQWNGAAGPIGSFFDVRKDPLILSEQFYLPDEAEPWSGSIDQLAELQRVGGRTVGDLFDGSRVDLSREDKRAISQAGSGRRRQESRQAFTRISGAESDVKARVLAVRGEALAVAAETHLLEAVHNEIRAYKAKQEEAKAQGELDKINREIKDVISVLTFVVDLPKKITEMSTPVGALKANWSMVAEQVFLAANAEEIQRLKRRISEARSVQKAAAEAQLMNRYNAQVKEFERAILGFERAQVELGKALADRVSAYDATAGQVGRLAGGGIAGRRVEGLIAAIPRVEAVVSRLDTIVHALGNGSGDPRYTKESGIGFHMAIYAGHWEAMEFISALSGLRQWRVEFQDKRDLWQRRRQALLHTKTRIVGRRAGADES